MSTLLKRLGDALFGGDGTGGFDCSAPALRLTVKCAKCGELITVRIDKEHELQCEYNQSNGSRHDGDEEPRPSGYTLLKELVGAHCQNLVRVEMHFDACKHIGARHIDGGEFAEVANCE